MKKTLGTNLFILKNSFSLLLLVYSPLYALLYLHKKRMFDIILERAEEKKKYFLNAEHYAGLIKKRAMEIFEGEVRVFLFGSVVKGNYTLSSGRYKRKGVIKWLSAI